MLLRSCCSQVVRGVIDIQGGLSLTPVYPRQNTLIVCPQVEGLYQVTSALDLLQSQRMTLEDEISVSTDSDSIRLIRNSLSDRDDAVTTSARARLSELGSAETSSSQQSFVTARSSDVPNAHETVKHDAIVPHQAVATRARNQNERIMADVLANATLDDKHRYPSSDRDASYGRIMKSFQEQHRKTSTMTSNRWHDETRPPPRRWASSFRGYKSLERELLYFITCNDIPGITLTPVGDNIRYFLAGIEGPQGTPYAGGLFWLRIMIAEQHPFRPPRMTFLTQIYHPNIDSQGRICIDILSDQYSTELTLQKCLLSITSMLAHPGLEEPLVMEIAQTYINDRDTYNANAALYTQKCAHEPPPSFEEMERQLDELNKEERRQESTCYVI